MKNKDYVSVTVLCHCNGFVPGRADVSPAIAAKLIAEGNAEAIAEEAETKILEKGSDELNVEVKDPATSVDGITDSNKGDQ